MNLRALKYFVAVLEKGSISAAAKHCYIAQPSISTAIVQLEKQLNSQLFIRHGKGVRPTEAGLRLYPLAQKLLSESQAIESLFNAPVQRAAFKLGLIRSLGVQRMSELLKEFTHAANDIELTLVEPSETADARIITTTDLTSSEQFEAIWRDNYVLAIPASFSLRLQSKINLSDLDQQPFIYRAPCEALSELQQLMDLEGLQLQIRARIQTIEYAIGLVSAGVGIALVPDIPAITEQKNIVFRKLQDIELKRTVGLALPREQLLSAPQKLLQQICQQNKNQTPPLPHN
ncbi:LysR family transcriptional regulator [Shewanella waksmanii]|uniref:LysR family transcriptional regulator n=1 Tax=Shewanella waksmanii TaxID=213783 RepID=UPI0037364DE8